MSDESENPVIYRKVLRMVQELHILGYQCLRIMPSMAPSGMHWRCDIAAAIHFQNSNGAILAPDSNQFTAKYSSGMERQYFDWRDSAHDTPFELALKFIDRFPEICRQSKGRDWPYVGWYVEMMTLTYPDLFPVAIMEYNDLSNHLKTVGVGRSSDQSSKIISLPPPGHAVDLR